MSFIISLSRGSPQPITCDCNHINEDSGFSDFFLLLYENPYQKQMIIILKNTKRVAGLWFGLSKSDRKKIYKNRLQGGCCISTEIAREKKD